MITVTQHVLIAVVLVLAVWIAVALALGMMIGSFLSGIEERAARNFNAIVDEYRDEWEHDAAFERTYTAKEIAELERQTKDAVARNRLIAYLDDQADRHDPDDPDEA